MGQHWHPIPFQSASHNLFDFSVSSLQVYEMQASLLIEPKTLSDRMHQQDWQTECMHASHRSAFFSGSVHTLDVTPFHTHTSSRVRVLPGPQAQE